MTRSASGGRRAPVDEGEAAPVNRLLSCSDIATVTEALTGRRPSPSTVSRWLLRGSGGRRIPFTRVGGRLYARKGAVLAFLNADHDGSVGLLVDDAGHAKAVGALLGTAWGPVASKPAKSRRRA